MAKSKTGSRGFYDLQPGDRFKALIQDIKPGRVTIQLADGGSFTARTTVLPEARIGETSFFAVRENNFKGQILLEMVKLEMAAKQESVLREALFHAGMVMNDENVALGRILISHHMPVDGTTLQRAAFFKYVQEDLTTAQLLFLLREDIPAEARYARIVAQMPEKPWMLHNALSSLAEEIRNGEPLFAAEMADALLSGSGVPKHTEASENGVYGQHAIRKGLFLGLNAKDTGAAPRQVLRHYYHNLWLSVHRALAIAQERQQTRAAEQLTHIIDGLKFLTQIKRRREYYQIPFYVEPHTATAQAELHLFKDTGGRDWMKQANFLIALNTAEMGRVEVYAQKAQRQVSFQFRCEQEESARLLRGQAHKLAQALKEKGIQVAGTRYETLDEAFTLLDPDPGAGQNEMKKEAAPKRFTFDMRV